MAPRCRHGLRLDLDGRLEERATHERGAMNDDSKPKVFWDDDFIDVIFKAIGDDGAVTTHT
jgi:hypothetical protein